MSAGVWFWLVMALWLFSGVWLNWPSPSQPAPPYVGWGNSLLLFVLFLILGFAVFGSPIK